MDFQQRAVSRQLRVIRPSLSLRTGRPLVGGPSFHGVSGPCASSLAHRLPAGIQAQGMRRRPMQAWVSGSWSGQLPVIRTLRVALSAVSSVDPTTGTEKRNQRLTWRQR